MCVEWRRGSEKTGGREYIWSFRDVSRASALWQVRQSDRQPERSCIGSCELSTPDCMSREFHIISWPSFNLLDDTQLERRLLRRTVRPEWCSWWESHTVNLKCMAAKHTVFLKAIYKLIIFLQAPEILGYFKLTVCSVSHLGGETKPHLNQVLWLVCLYFNFQGFEGVFSMAGPVECLFLYFYWVSLGRERWRLASQKEQW